MLNQSVQRVVFQPDSYLGMQRGINQMANVIRPTLGPLPRHVAVSHPLAHRTPELLDNGAVIAKRLLQLPDRDADMGAMFLRHVLWHVHGQTGDGTATAAVLLQSVYNQGIQYIAAGGNPMQLRRHLEQGTRIILTELNRMTIHLEGEEKLIQIAETICHDPPLAKMMGEIFDIIGEYGRLEVQASHGRDLERQYIEGLYWQSEIYSREMIADHTTFKTDLQDPAILMTNHDITEATQLVPLMELVLKAKIPSLMVIANKLSDEVVALLVANTKPETFRAMAVKAPGIGPTKQAEALQDMVILTGGHIFLQASGERDLTKVTLQDLGRARKAWANLHHFGLVGGKGDPRLLRRHIADLRSAFKRAQDQEARQGLQQRIGKLIGGSATLKIGGATKAEIRARKTVAEQTAEAMRGALIEGVLPGAGMALMACRPALQQCLDAATDPDERAAYQVLITALAEPMRTIIANAGYEPGEILGEISGAGPGYGFDVNAGRVVEIAQAGIFDSASVQKTALQSAVASAALALTTEVLVHHKNPPAPAVAGPGSG